MRTYEKWAHTDADFTLGELADTIAWLLTSGAVPASLDTAPAAGEAGADFDPTDTELLRKEN